MNERAIAFALMVLFPTTNVHFNIKEVITESKRMKVTRNMASEQQGALVYTLIHSQIHINQVCNEPVGRYLVPTGDLFKCL